MQRRTVLGIEIIPFVRNAERYFGAFWQVRWLVELESAVVHAGSKGLHAAKDIASRVLMPVSGGGGWAERTPTPPA